MKCFKKVLSLVAAAAITVTGLGFNSLSADAANPTTYYLKYDLDKGQWRMQVNEWLDDYEGRELYYLNEGSDKVKDGDVVVVLENEEQASGSTNIAINARLSNLTINRSTAMITVSGGIDNCYVLGESYTAITGNVANAYVYDDAKCTFHSNVTNLSLIASQANDVDVDVSVKGTVAYASVSNAAGIIRQYYNFAANTFYYDHSSGLMTDPSNYSTTGSAPAASAAAETTAPAASTASGTTASASSSGAYDDVPKTGESNLVIWLFALSAASLAGCLALRKNIAK